LQQKNTQIVDQILAALPERERQALVRFYVHGEPVDVVCRQAGLTEAQFRLIKTRTKASFLALVRSA
jgi:DNA-directed RNA polymerase specialized sigma24 family protein